MKSTTLLLVALLSFSLSCSSTQRMARVSEQKGVAQPVAAPANTETYSVTDAVQAKKVSLNEVDKAESTAEAADRKIIRNADITIEVPSTTDAQHQVTFIAESHGGFV